jgi:hypothetical protein
MIRLVALVVLALAALGNAEAHTLSVARVHVTTTDATGVLVEVDLPLAELARETALDTDADGRLTWGELAAARTAVEALVQDGLVLLREGEPCALQSQDFGVRRYDEGPYAAARLVSGCPDLTGAELDYRLFFAGNARHRAVVSSSSGQIAIATAAAPRIAFDQPGGGFFAFVIEGVYHIAIGFDHIAFLLSLLLGAALRREHGRWRGARDFRASLTVAATVVTAFTLAHSITLSLAALQLVVPASGPVEIAIAASVVLAALNNVWPVITRRLWLLAFGFGLVHGFGFAGVLGELGLPVNARASALIGFNLGVELGQLAIVALALPLLYAVRRWPAYPRAVMAPASLALAACGGFWLIERVAG